MKIELTDELSLDGYHDIDTHDELKPEYITIQIGHKRETINIDVLISALETMKKRKNN